VRWFVGMVLGRCRASRTMDSNTLDRTGATVRSMPGARGMELTFLSVSHGIRIEPSA
jgi:hypothetical protein